MSSPEEVQKFRTSLKSVGEVLGIAYRTLDEWQRWYHLRGRRGRKRYGLTEMTRFRFIAQLSRSGIFDRKQITSALSFITWMTEKDVNHDSQFFIHPLEGGEVHIIQFSPQKFPSAVQLAVENGIPGCFISLSGLAAEVIGRVTAHLDKVPFVGVGERAKQSLLLAAGARNAVLQ